MERLAVPSQPVSSSPQQLEAELSRLRARVAELEKQQEWTSKQHQLWADERRSMIRTLRDLRAGEWESQYIAPLLHWFDALRGRFSRNPE